MTPHHWNVSDGLDPGVAPAPAYVETLVGIVFLSQQFGSFLGVWSGGVLYDAYGSYNVVWWLSIALGLLAALLRWPIDERAVARLRVPT